MPPDGEIKNQVERLIENPVAVVLHARLGHDVVHGVIDKEPDVQRVPLDGVPVEAAIERPASQRMSERRVTRIPRAVHGRARRGDVAAVVFHDVELTTRGPADALDVLAQQTKDGPESLTRRELEARFDSAR